MLELAPFLAKKMLHKQLKDISPSNIRREEEETPPPHY